MDLKMYTEKDIGIYSFLSHSEGVGGKLRKNIEDFYVEEVPYTVEKHENGKHLYIKVKLRNWETNRFVKILSRQLGISRRRIKFAGTKDKRGITIQYFCILNYSDDININLKDVDILEKFRSNYELKLGDLIGNRFRIKISDAICDSRVEKIEKELNGFFPNFFGVQRFGAHRPITHIIGKFIVKKQFDEAVRYYVGFPPEEDGRRIFFESMDAREALKNIDPRAEYERAILNHLVKNPSDYIGALQKLPENLLLMFVHGYQGYLFNKMVSERLRYGVEVMEGDVILKTDAYGIPIQEYVKVNQFNIEKIKKRISERKAYISTLLFGFQSSFSGGIQGKIEKEVIETEDISHEDFKIREIRGLSSKGRRRAILAPILEYSRNGCVFSFMLLKGCYATSLMREFMKNPKLDAY